MIALTLCTSAAWPAAPPEFVVLAPGATLYATAAAVDAFAVLPADLPFHAAWLGEEGGRVRVATVDWAQGHCTAPLHAISADLELFVERSDLVPVVSSRATWAGAGRSVVLGAGVPVLDGVVVLPEGLRVDLPIDPGSLAVRYRERLPGVAPRALPDLVLPAGTVLDLGGAVLTAPSRVVMPGSRLAGALTTPCGEILAPGVGLESLAADPSPGGHAGTISALVGPEPPPSVPPGSPLFDRGGTRIGRVSYLLREGLVPDGARECGPIRLGWDATARPVVCVEAGT